MKSFVAVIMAGGSGTRFWPVSTAERPKQFLDLEGTGRTLLQATFDRLEPLTGGPEGVFVIAGERYRQLILEQLPELPEENLLIEPVGRDTAPAVALAALTLEGREGNPVMGIFAADHRVGNVAEFHRVVRQAASLAQEVTGLVTLGITPDHPATGYGYIQAGASLGGVGFQVERFVEKPDRATAEDYLAHGGYYWNSGNFLWQTSTIVGEFERHAPQLLAELRDALGAGRVAEVFPTLEKISIDYAVMEKTDKAYVVPADYDWDDIGDWSAVERYAPQQGDNTVMGTHVALESQGNIIYADEGATVATIGIEDLVIVQRGNTVLVARKDRTQDVKALLQRPELTQT